MEIVSETPRLLLRKYVPADIVLFHAIASDVETMAHYPAPFTVEKSKEWIARAIRSYEEHGFGRYAALLKETGEYIGCAGLFRTTVNERLENDLGYIVAKSHWGRGYATEAARGVLDSARDHAWCSRVVLNMASDHLKSSAVARRLGATLETTFINPRNRDKPTDLYVIDL